MTAQIRVSPTVTPASPTAALGWASVVLKRFPIRRSCRAPHGSLFRRHPLLARQDHHEHGKRTHVHQPGEATAHARCRDCGCLRKPWRNFTRARAARALSQPNASVAQAHHGAGGFAEKYTLPTSGTSIRAAEMPENNPGVIVARNHPKRGVRKPTARASGSRHSGHLGAAGRGGCSRRAGTGHRGREGIPPAVCRRRAVAGSRS